MDRSNRRHSSARHQPNSDDSDDYEEAGDDQVHTPRPYHKRMQQLFLGGNQQHLYSGRSQPPIQQSFGGNQRPPSQYQGQPSQQQRRSQPSQQPLVSSQQGLRHAQPSFHTEQQHLAQPAPRTIDQSSHRPPSSSHAPPHLSTSTRAASPYWGVNYALSALPTPGTTNASVLSSNQRRTYADVVSSYPGTDNASAVSSGNRAHSPPTRELQTPSPRPTESSYYDTFGVGFDDRDPESQAWIRAEEVRQQHAGIPAATGFSYPSEFKNHEGLDLPNLSSGSAGGNQQPIFHHPLTPGTTQTWTSGRPGGLRVAYCPGEPGMEVIFHQNHGPISPNGQRLFARGKYVPRRAPSDQSGKKEPDVEKGSDSDETSNNRLQRRKRH